MKGVPEAVRASIEEAQPYWRSEDDAAQHPLAQLSALSNLDKHRVLTTFISAVTHEGVGISEGTDLTWNDMVTNKRQWIARHVYRVMAEVDTGEKLSPFAPYPL